MPTLHLGIADVPYTDGDKTTGDVAEILEEKYGIMAFFVNDVGTDAIGRAIEQSAMDAITTLLAGGPPGMSLTAEAESEIEAAFKLFLSQREMDGKVPGVPTAAAIRGVSHRLKRPYVKSNPERPSFIDTGLYQASFKAWVD